MSTKAHEAAVIAALTAADARPYTPGQLKDLTVPPTSYNEVYVMERLGTGPRRNGSLSDSTQWRIFIRSVAQRYANAQEMRDRAATALHEAKLTVGSDIYYVERSISDDPIGPDDGWWSGTSEFIY